MGLTIGIDLGVLIGLISIFFYVFVKNVITAQYKVYLLFHFFMMIWPIGQVGVHTTDRPHLQIFYITLSFVGLSMLGFGWMLFTKFLSLGTYYKPSGNVVLLLLAPSLLLSVAMIWNPANLFVAPVDGGYGERQYGPLFWCMFLLLVASFLYSLRLVRDKSRMQTQQAERARLKNAFVGIVVMAVFPLLDLLTNVVLDPWLPVIPGITSFGILASDICFLYALRKHRSLDLVKIAQQDVVDTLSVGIIVLDEQDIVVEINRNVGSKLNISIGKKLQLEAFLDTYAVEANAKPAFLKAFRMQSGERAQTELAFSAKDGKKQYLSMHAVPILIGGSLLGKVITLQDITELKLHILKSQEQNISLQERNRALIYMQDELFQANRKLEQMAVTDSLTGCFNRRFLMQQLEHEVLTNLRYKIPFALFLFDIDLFKLVNDNYGHVVGDEVIRRTAEAVRGALRRTDILARYGGEEFAVYLPHTNQEQAELLAQRIREVVECNVVPTGRGRPPISVTISMGMHVVEEQTDLTVEDVKLYLKELFDNIDSALYRAKDNGRNRIVNH